MCRILLLAFASAIIAKTLSMSVLCCDILRFEAVSSLPKRSFELKFFQVVKLNFGGKNV